MRAISLVAGAVTLVALTGAARAVTRPDPEEAAVRAAVEHYLQGHATGQADHFRQGMHEQGMMYFVRDGKLVLRSFPDYFAGASGKPAEDEAKRKRRIAMVDITGTAAMAKVVLEYPGVTLTDYMELLKIEGRWQIVAKSFHAERLGS